MKKFISTILIAALLFTNITVGVFAQEAPSAPTPPPAPEAPSAPTPPPEPTPPTYSYPTPTPPSVPTPPPSPSPYVEPTPTPPPTWVTVSPSPEPTTQNTSGDSATNDSSGGTGDASLSISGTTGTTLGDTTGEQNASHGQGDPFINTGDADSSAILTNDVNSNLGSAGGNAGDINVGNSGNGSDSTNSGDVNTSNSSDTIQINSADVGNNLNLASISGDNATSYNTGVDNTIISGDATTTATVINGVNTNIDGVAVIEFNVNDTHTGDIILAFPDVSGCTASVCGTNGTLSATNTGNGADSTNDAGITTTNTDQTFQENSADVTNDLTLVAESGSNEASYNTGGDSSITTGDATVVATVGNFVNNNLAGAGNVILAVVNIFGDLVGNILLPESSVAEGGTTVANTDNGSGSTNTADVTSTATNDTTQVNNATVTNNINVGATTGDNTTQNNTAGFSNGGNVIETGDASVDVNTINLVNSNVAGGDYWWLVFVNDASGNWVGRIVGSPEGSTMGGSAGTEFIMLADGTIIAQNTGNGSGSTNTATVDTDNSSSTTQTNNATITNNLNLTANTGGNEASHNTGGGNTIKTGDAAVMANILNFVNNNFAGGRVVVSVINVFGSWLGSFVPPGMEAPAVAQIGGASPESTSGSQGNSQGNSNNSNTANNSAANSESETEVLGTVDAGVEVAFNWQGLKFGGTTDENPPAGGPPPGTVIEDDSIVVPGRAKTASATTFIPSWFWKLFAGALALVILKKISQKLKIKKVTPAAV